MKILAIDPGYERLGIAVLEKSSETNQKEILLHSECFKTLKEDPHHIRLRQVGEKIESIIKKFKPEILAVETLFFSKNTKTAMKVSEARGVILERSSAGNLDIFEFSPQAIKIAVTGIGNSDKNNVMKMIPLLISLPENSKKQDDEFDAIATGLTFFATHHHKYPQV